MQLTFDGSILEKLLAHAASAAREVPYLDHGITGGALVSSLADKIDAIVHDLGELLGNLHVVAAPRSDPRSGLVLDVAPRGGTAQDSDPVRASHVGGGR